MKKVKIQQVTLHHIDIGNNTIEEDDLKKEVATNYINAIIQKSIENKNIRYFNKVKGGLIDYIVEFAYKKDKGYEQNNIAKALLKAETKAQERIIKMNKEIKKGSLIQAILKSEEEGCIFYIISKVEHISILDKDQWKKHTGLPVEQEILKTCIIKISETMEVDEIKMFDTNKQVSEYWSNSFLNTKPVTTDEDNTMKSFKELDKFFVKNIKKKNPSDYIYIFNNMMAYYNQNSDFDYNEFVKVVLLSYKSENILEEEIVALAEKMQGMTENKFDRQFSIVNEIIKNKKKRTFDLSSDIELTIKDNIENLSDIIIAEKTEDNNLYIKIKVDKETFDTFHFSVRS